MATTSDADKSRLREKCHSHCCRRSLSCSAVWTICFLLFACYQPTKVYAGFVDMDTPLDKRTTKSLVDDSVYHLIMSDEFNVANRSFKDGHDPVWTALDKSDDDSSSAGGGSMQFYNSSSCTTVNGTLNIATTLGKTSWKHHDPIKKTWVKKTTYFRSGMMQSWEKFCFTGGIIEVDIIFPGNPFIGGLWPAVWMLGNLGRATYEASTNNIWPWSFDTCDRKMQDRQTISACNSQNHYGLHPYQGRGATEIDLVEVMTGDSKGPFASTDPPVGLPYADMTLQVAPGIEKNRPQSGDLPSKNDTVVNGFTQFHAQTWYKGLEYNGNTSINPFFYGTYLAETKPEEPVTRTKKQAFQADAVGVVHQLTESHFQKMHTIRLEWQPGPGGRIDWYTKGYQRENENGTYYTTGDGDGEDWVPVFSLKEDSIKGLMGSQIPIEPTYLIMNTAVSSTWGFPYDVPDWCEKCFDCDDPKCACAISPGFCQTMREGNVAMKIDSIRVYQSRDPSAHVGANHTLGCDPPDYPTKEFIQGHEYRYMRNPPFVFDDKHPLRRVQKGGGECKSDADCGAYIHRLNLTQVYEDLVSKGGSAADFAEGNATSSSAEDQHRRAAEASASHTGMGRCVDSNMMAAMFSTTSSRRPAKVCLCNKGYTGPTCHSQAHFDDSLTAVQVKASKSPFLYVSFFQATPFMLAAICIFVTFMLVVLVSRAQEKKRPPKEVETPLKRPMFVTTAGEDKDTLITGTSI